MATLEIFFTFFFFFHFLIPHIATTTCGGSTCTSGGPVIRFPFRLKPYQPSICGYQGFDDLISCNKKSETILTLPSSRRVELTVQYLDYENQMVSIGDPDNCLPKLLLNHDINLTGSPFSFLNGPEEHTLLNCSSSTTDSTLWSFPIISCLSSGYYKVIAMPTSRLTLPPYPWVPWKSLCTVISTAVVPAWYLLEGHLLGTWLKWNDSARCRSCEARGHVCGLEINTTATTTSWKIECFGSSKSLLSGQWRFRNLSIVIVVGIVGVFGMIGVAHFVRGRLHQQPITELSNIDRRRALGRLLQRMTQVLTNRHPPAAVNMGLDGSTIESYPKTQLGQTWELPDSNDHNTCPICLCDYQPKDTLRTIPQCNHYFHATCVDQWLRMNATCPLCRNNATGG